MEVLQSLGRGCWGMRRFFAPESLLGLLLPDVLTVSCSRVRLLRPDY